MNLALFTQLQNYTTQAHWSLSSGVLNPTQLKMIDADKQYMYIIPSPPSC